MASAVFDVFTMVDWQWTSLTSTVYRYTDTVVIR